MLMALALLAAIEAAPSPTVSLTLTGGADRAPVSATPRSLSDVARELREGRKAVGGFSAMESTVASPVPQSPSDVSPVFEPEPVAAAPQPEVVSEQPPMYAPDYLPAWVGPGQKIGRFHPRPAPRFATPRAASPPPRRTFAAPTFQPHRITAGRLRER
jgi:hypothetical protein